MSFRLFVLHLLAVSAGVAQTDRERFLLDKIRELEARLEALEKRLTPPAPAAVNPTPPAPPLAPPPPPAEEKTSWMRDTTAGVHFDGYYAWNTNRPLGRINLLRAYDVTANNFSMNQTGIILERAPNDDRRWGYRLDLMYGPATETLQGGAQNEPRPQVYRNLFQAYGTYVLPVGRGLTADFGKWASALGPEGNYTKDQIHYSRSYFFNFLPFYHTGLRATLPVRDRLSLTYWLVNGANQTEDFNGFKSQLAQAVWTPASNVTWTVNYYNGREQRDLVPALSPELPTLPTQPGLSIVPVRPLLRGRLHILDTYAFWNATPRLTLGGELDYVVNRVDARGPAQVVSGGAGYLRYQISRRTYWGQRYVRLNDRAGLFSGTPQRLNDVTSTLGFRPGEGFETRLEYRRDFSDTPFFLRQKPGQLSRHQNTIAVGLLWWFWGKAGAW